MDEDKAPLSMATRRQLESVLVGDQYRLVRAGRVILSTAALVVVLGMVELFLTPSSPGSSSSVFDELGAVQAVGRLFEIAVRAFVLLLGAQLLQLWLDLFAAVRELEERVTSRGRKLLPEVGHFP
jgi:hypothetical protein